MDLFVLLRKSLKASSSEGSFRGRPHDIENIAISLKRCLILSAPFSASLTLFEVLTIAIAFSSHPDASRYSWTHTLESCETANLSG